MVSLKRGIFLVALLILFSVTAVSALDACCELTTDGDWCVYTDEANCDASGLTSYTTCEQTSYCQLGTCYGSDTGSCYENTARATCEAEEGATWSEQPADELLQCQQGCCVIGDQASFVTEVKCKSVGSDYEDAAVSFDSSIQTEAACLATVKNLDFGCCVTEDGAEYVTREECSVGDVTEVGTNFTVEGFHEGMLCSNDLLTTECAKQHHTGCYQGDVYWYDSCGNRENIYSDDERASYNDGYALDEQDSCTLNGAYDPSCGNCDYTTGTLCAEDDEGVMEVGDYTCIDLTCEETFEHDASPLSGYSRLNGESWCVYDSRPGEGQDAVGSRHYRHICINGEELVEECADFREEICINGVLSEDVFGTLESFNLDGNTDYTEAACRINRAECAVCNDPDAALEDKVACCNNEDARDCHWLGDESSDGICVPEVPLGQKFWSDDGSGSDTSDAAVCAEASTECVVTYRIGGVKNILKEKIGSGSDPDDWELVSESPDGCTSRNWAVDQNNYCASLGDCGAYYNYIGEAGLEGFSSNLFDEDFFFEHDEFSTRDLVDWDYLSSVDEIVEGDEIWGFNSPSLWKNPATYIAAASMLVGGTAGLRSCNAADSANALIRQGQIDVNAANALEAAEAAAAAASSATPDCPSDYSISSGKADDHYLYKCASGGGYLSCDTNTGSYDAGAVQTEADAGHPVLSCAGVSERGSSSSSSSSGGTTDTTKCPSDYTLSDGTYVYKCVSGGFKSCKVSDPSEFYSECNDDTKCVQSTTATADHPVLSCADVTYTGASSAAPAYAADLDFTSAFSTGSSILGTATQLQAFGAGAECFISSGLPVIGLFQQSRVNTISEDQFNAIDAATSYGPAILSNAKKAQSATGVSKWANVAGVIAIAYLAVEYTADNETTITYNVECGLWQPPSGGDNCELCNNENTPCSEYKCRSLGASCDLVNEGTSEEICVSLHVNDVNSPIIEPLEEVITDGYTLRTTTEEGNNGYEIVEEIPAFSNIQIGIKTDEPAQCKYAADPSVEFLDMNNFFGSEVYLYNHSLMFSLGEEFTDEDVMALTEGEYTLYVRCADANGNANERDYFIRWTVDDTPDLTPPEVVFTSIESGSYMPYGLNETSFSIYTNEPASCKWNVNDTSYEFMANTMDCPESGFEQSSIYYGTYECSTTLTGVSDAETSNYYFRCEDQSGNINEDSYKFSLRRTENPLEVISISPEGDVFDSDVVLEVETINGAENGVANCRYYSEDIDYSSMIDFVNTNSTLHTQDLILPEGEYDYYVTCQDVAGNRASNSTSITVSVDLSGPQIVNLYIDTAYAVLVMEMDEESTCEYATESFVYGEGTLMTGEGDTVHEASLESLYYYVICEDVYLNQASYEIDISAWV